MHLVPKELDKLVISQLGFLAQRRLARGIRLNHAEATALIANNLHELIREGKMEVEEVKNAGMKMLGERHVLPSVVASLKEVLVEGTFRTGTFLVAVENPICSKDGSLKMALYGSFLPEPLSTDFEEVDKDLYKKENQPGAIIAVKKGKKISLHRGRRRALLCITNTGDRPIQIGSHYHLIESNPELKFDRLRSYGYILDIPAGTAVRFEPGDIKTVGVVEIGGKKIIRGGNNIAPGRVERSRADEITRRLVDGGFQNHDSDHEDSEHITTDSSESDSSESDSSDSDDSSHDSKKKPKKPQKWKSRCSMSRKKYALMFGPTKGDRVRLGATDLWIEIEKDFTSYGDECTFGGGKTVRDGHGQMSGCSDLDSLDTVIINAIIVDWSGIVKADIGIKNGMIVGIGKAGNPDTMDGVDPNMVIGACTDVIAAEGKIITAGAIDTHVHFICPQQVAEAMSSGVTTMYGGGTGPSTSTNATTCTPGATHIRQMFQACDSLPVNIGLTGKGSDCDPLALREQCIAGVTGLKIHEDWGATPAIIDTCLSVCDEFDVQCLLHSDTLNESGFVAQTVAAFKDRVIHTYHTEGAGGGHAPDILKVVENANVLPSSTNPTRPYTINTVAEHIKMLMVCHHLSPSIPEDQAFADSRIRFQTIAAEDVLHDIGAVSMMSSDSQAMGRCGEVILRTWHTAHKNKLERGQLKEDAGTDADNFRVKRYISKYTINPAIAQGMSHIIGSVEVGKLADLCLWTPANFGTKPSIIIKSGMISHALVGDPNAAIPTVQPMIMRPMFSPLVPQTSIAFVSKASVHYGTIASYNLKKRIEVVKNCRNITKKDMKYNDLTPKMEVDPLFKKNITAGTGDDEVVCVSEAAEVLPLTQQYYIF